MQRLMPKGTAPVNNLVVPKDQSPSDNPVVYQHAVERSFGNALIWHMDQHGTGVAQLSRATGVSTDVIKKMRTRPGSTTTAENAVAISRYYGKTVTQFLECDEAVAIAKLVHLIDLLTPEEQDQLERQVLGLLQTRGSTPSR